MLELYVWLTNLFRREEGQGLVEYALIIFLVALAVVAALILLGTQVDAIFRQITGQLSGAGS